MRSRQPIHESIDQAMFVLPCDNCGMGVIERWWIKKLRPKYNRQSLIPIKRIRANANAKKVGRPATGQEPTRTFRLSDELWNALKLRAYQEETTPSKVIREFLQRYVRRK